ncbi:hypothetical protein DFJ73DRAFT_358589 [Zopfochytrium polystomum]|nr:hypothetical protein DFJ73DRAFT_358589 [Zopfochytrium polystomum]
MIVVISAVLIAVSHIVSVRTHHRHRKHSAAEIVPGALVYAGRNSSERDWLVLHWILSKQQGEGWIPCLISVRGCCFYTPARWSHQKTEGAVGCTEQAPEMR